MVFNILSREGDAASIPCLATDPSLDNLRLETCSSGALASGLQYSSSLEQGISIQNTQKAYEGCYVCTGRLREERVRSHDYYLTVRPGKVMKTNQVFLHRRQVNNNKNLPQFPALRLPSTCRHPKE